MHALLSPCQAAQVAAALAAPGSALLPRDLVSALASLAKLRQRPAAAWLEVRIAQLSRGLPQLGADELSMLLYACARLGYSLPPSLVLEIIQRLGSRLSTCSVSHLVLVPWSLKELQSEQPVPRVFLDCLVEEAGERQSDLHLHELSTLLHGLSGLDYKCEEPALQHLIHRLVLKLKEGQPSPRCISSLCCSLARLCAPAAVPMALQQALVTCCARQLPDFTNQGFSNMLWGLARICEKRMPGEVVRAACLEMRYRMPGLSAADLSMCLWGLAHMRPAQHLRPVERWMGEVWERAVQLLPTMETQSLTTLLYTSCWLHYTPQAEHLQVACDVVGMHSASLEPELLHSLQQRLRQLYNNRRLIRIRGTVINNYFACLVRQEVLRAQGLAGGTAAVLATLPSKLVLRPAGLSPFTLLSLYQQARLLYRHQVGGINLRFVDMFHLHRKLLAEAKAQQRSDKYTLKLWRESCRSYVNALKQRQRQAIAQRAERPGVGAKVTNRFLAQKTAAGSHPAGQQAYFSSEGRPARRWLPIPFQHRQQQGQQQQQQGQQQQQQQQWTTMR
ncbi:hypothetical protein V8C86DRAFT_2929466 [Haematococcus lacustris]